MKSLIFFFLLLLIVSACSNGDELKAKELELRERELALKEKEMENGSLQSGNDYSENSYSGSEQSQGAESEEDMISDLYDIESRSPKNYLSANYTYRVNLAANTIIEGEISNSASVAGFKNVELTVYFYSKTDRVLGEETFTVMEFVPPNGSVSFRYKISGWWDKVSYSDAKILSAEAY